MSKIAITTVIFYTHWIMTSSWLTSLLTWDSVSSRLHHSEMFCFKCTPLWIYIFMIWSCVFAFVLANCHKISLIIEKNSNLFFMTFFPPHKSNSFFRKKNIIHWLCKYQYHHMDHYWGHTIHMDDISWIICANMYRDIHIYSYDFLFYQLSSIGNGHINSE